MGSAGILPADRSECHPLQWLSRPAVAIRVYQDYHFYN